LGGPAGNFKIRAFKADNRFDLGESQLLVEFKVSLEMRNSGLSGLPSKDEVLEITGRVGDVGAMKVEGLKFFLGVVVPNHTPAFSLSHLCFCDK